MPVRRAGGDPVRRPAPIERDAASAVAVNLRAAREVADGLAKASAKGAQAKDAPASAPHVLRGRYFDAAREFPNPFLSGPKPTAAERKAVRAEMERALTSIFRRVTFPLPKEGGDGVTMVPFFEAIAPLLEDPSLDPGAKALPSGGVVRSALGYLADRLKGARDPVAALRAIASEDRPIPVFEILGVGSDWDILVVPGKGDTEKLVSAIHEVINRAQVHAGVEGKAEFFKRNFWLTGDVHEYGAQMARNLPQGGCTLDWTAFDPASGAFVEPPGHEGVVSDFLSGVLHYVRTTPKSELPEPDLQTSRGPRALVEIPFLSYDPQSEALLCGELADLEARAEAGDDLSLKALQQFEKLARNAREGGGSNRLLRGAPGTIEAHVARLAEVLGDEDGSLIPEFVDHVPLEVTAPRAHELPDHLLMPVDEFFERFTDDGVLHHGTPNMNSGLAILRGGIFVSSATQGKALFGRGAYFTKDKVLASSYASSNGMVLDVAVKRDPRLRVLDRAKAANDKVFQRICVEAKDAGREPYEFLASEFGVHVVADSRTDNHPDDLALVQNTAALELPRTPLDIIPAYASVIESQERDIGERLRALDFYGRLYTYASAQKLELAAPADFLPAFAQTLDGLGKKAIGRDELALLATYAELRAQARPKVQSETRPVESFLPWLSKVVEKDGAIQLDAARAEALLLYATFYAGADDAQKAKLPAPKSFAKLVVQLLEKRPLDWPQHPALLELYAKLVPHPDDLPSPKALEHRVLEKFLNNPFDQHSDAQMRERYVRQRLAKAPLSRLAELFCLRARTVLPALIRRAEGDDRPALKAALRSKVPAERAAAALGLCLATPPEDAAAKVLAELIHEDPWSHGAVHAVRDLGPKVPVALQRELAARLGPDDPNASINAWMLAEMAPKDAKVRAHLKAARDRDSDSDLLRSSVKKALGEDE